MMRHRGISVGGAVVLAGVMAAMVAPAAPAATTIGVDVNQAFNYTGSCSGGMNPLNRPCTVVNLETTPARTMQSPCDGTVVRYRLNGVVSANTYRLRAVTDNGNGSYTPTATSTPPVSIISPGVNEYVASMPIKLGQFVGIDFMDSTAAGLRGFGGPGFLEAYFYTFPADGTPDTPTGEDAAIYLYDADVECGGPPPAKTKCKKKKKKGKKKSAAAAKKKKKKKCKKKGKKKK
jgi:hypothetical protein